MDTEKFLKETEVSKITGIALSTLRHRRCRGEGPVYRKIGRSVFYALTDVMTFMESHKITPRTTEAHSEGDKLQ